MHGRSPSKIKPEKVQQLHLKVLLEKQKENLMNFGQIEVKRFIIKTFLNFLKEQNIHIYSTHSDLKAVFVERFNRTLLDLIKEPMYIEGKACWLIHLDTAMEKYNNRVHGTTKMTPFEISTNQKLKPNKKIIYYKHNTAKLASHTEGASRKQPKFQVGDYVRVPDKRNLYSKGFTPNWSRELFKMQKMNPTNPVTYGLVDENNEQIEGKYNEQELLRSVFNFKSNNKTLESMNIFHIDCAVRVQRSCPPVNVNNNIQINNVSS